jgi:hypothetical protein
MPLANFWRKKIAYFPSIFARISMFKHFRCDWAYAEPNIFGEQSKNFCTKFIICILIGIFWVSFKNYIMRLLYIQGNNFIHTVHARKQFHRTLSIRWTNFRICSASIQILTFLTWTSKRMLSIRGNKFPRMLSQRVTNFRMCSAKE